VCAANGRNVEGSNVAAEYCVVFEQPGTAESIEGHPFKCCAKTSNVAREHREVGWWWSGGGVDEVVV